MRVNCRTLNAARFFVISGAAVDQRSCVCDVYRVLYDDRVEAINFCLDVLVLCVLYTNDGLVERRVLHHL